MRTHSLRSPNPAMLAAAAIAALPLAHAGAEDTKYWWNIPILVNAYENSGLTRAEAEAAVAEANRIWAHACIRFTIAEGRNGYRSGLANPEVDGDGEDPEVGSSWTRAERDRARADGAKEIDQAFGAGKGVKVNFAGQPEQESANTNGIAIVGGRASAIQRETTNTGQTMAHELGHVLGLPDLPQGGNQTGRLMWGVFDSRTGTALSDGEKTTAQGTAGRIGTRVCQPVTEDGTPTQPTQPVPETSGGRTGEDRETDGGIADATYHATFDTPGSFRIVFDGTPVTGEPRAAQIALDSDRNPGTGVTFNDVSGIDVIVDAVLDGPFANAVVIDTVTGQVRPLAALQSVGLASSDARFDPLDPTEGQQTIEVFVEPGELGITPAPEPVNGVLYSGFEGPFVSPPVDGFSIRTSDHDPRLIALPPALPLVPDVVPVELNLFGLEPGEIVRFTADPVFAPSLPLSLELIQGTPVPSDPTAAAANDLGEIIAIAQIDLAPLAVIDPAPLPTGPLPLWVSAGSDALPVPPFAMVSLIRDTCPADFNGDGLLDIFDIIGFFELFGQGDPRADFNGDGLLDIFDIIAFFEAFGDGC